MGELDFLGGLFGGAATMASNAQQNQANMEMQQRSQLFEGKQAELNRGFQERMANSAMGFSERMSSTSHQREIADLRAAGLNPILSAGGGGSSSPSGVSAPGAMATGKMVNMKGLLEGAFATAKEMSMLDAQIRNLDADTLVKGATKLPEKYVKGFIEKFGGKILESMENSAKGDAKQKSPLTADPNKYTDEQKKFNKEINSWFDVDNDPDYPKRKK